MDFHYIDELYTFCGCSIKSSLFSKTANIKLISIFSGELERILRSDDDHRAHLSFEEITTVKRNLQTNSGIEVDNELIRETWHPVYRRHFLLKALGRCYDCRRGFFMYSKGIENDVSSVWPTVAVFLKYVIW